VDEQLHHGQATSMLPRVHRFHRTKSTATAFIAFGTVFGACGTDDQKLSCVVELGAAKATVPLDTKVGSSAVATVGGYTVDFTILEGSRLQGEVTDAHATSLMTSRAGGLAGSGGLGTPDGHLDYSCAL
jgi:hypothetical protein